MAETARPLAVVIGATGGIGSAILQALEDAGTHDTLSFSRVSEPPLDLTDERSIEAAARLVAERKRPVDLVFDATGFLHDDRFSPEKALNQIDPQHMAQAFALNSIGPALLMKHFLPLLPREGRSVFATLSAKVGSITDNHLGGWYSYRASKAALNQLVRTASIELKRTRPQAICVALHPGTVDTGLSGPFAKTGLNVHKPADAAAGLLRVIAGLDAADSGGFFDVRGERLPF
jgi:NAD(P)-dependent dehydrogenase (short-subunit alcohol dehydrogenase family)